MTYNTINDAVTMPDNTEGTLLAGRFRIVRQLGQGGMGSVWLAEDTQLDNKQFAIKMLPSILVRNKRAYRQLKDEALVAMKLVHPNIVQLRAFEENDGNPFLVMDYVDGQTLDDYLCEKGTLTEEKVIRILRPIAAALDYAHKRGVVHRDVKPGNVMIAKDGTSYILDFGIAREIQETMTRVTGKLSSGTLLYMSPEQLNGAPPEKGQDIYSFAVMVYECLKGEPPFCRGQIDRQILDNEPPPLPFGVADPRFVLSIMSGLAKNPIDRPAQCSVLLLDRSSEGFTIKHFNVKNSTQSGKIGDTNNIIRERSLRLSPVKVAHPIPKHIGLKMVVLTLAVMFFCIAGYVVFSIYATQEKEKRDVKEETKRTIREVQQRRLVVDGQREEMENIYVKASGLCQGLNHIDKEHGFEKLIFECNKLFGEADAFRNANRYCEAATAFSNVVIKSDNIIKADTERKSAIVEMNAAQELRDSAEKLEACVYDLSGYNDALTSFNKAVDCMGNMNLVEAEKNFRLARNKFNDTIGVTLDTKKRNEMEGEREAAFKYNNKVKSISDENGFKTKKFELDSRIEATKQLENNAKLDEARQSYANIKNEALTLLKLDEERNAALKSRKLAIEASNDAEQAGAKKYAREEWNKVTKGDWMQAEEFFNAMSFASAKEKYEAARNGYFTCISQAKDAEAAKVKAEEQRIAAEQKREQERIQEAEKRRKVEDEKRHKSMRSLPGRWRHSRTIRYKDRPSNYGSNDSVVYDFKNNGNFVCIINSSISRIEQTGKWLLNGNELIMRYTNSSIYYDNNKKDFPLPFNGEERNQLRWNQDGSFELRYDEKWIKSKKEATSNWENTFKDFYYDNEGYSHYVFEMGLFKVRYEQIENPRVFRREQ